jgi:hypothetical protein
MRPGDPAISVSCPPIAPHSLDDRLLLWIRSVGNHIGDRTELAIKQSLILPNERFDLDLGRRVLALSRRFLGEPTKLAHSVLAPQRLIADSCPANKLTG